MIIESDYQRGDFCNLVKDIVVFAKVVETTKFEL